MVKKDKKQKAQDIEALSLSTTQVLEEIGDAVLKEKNWRKKVKKQGNPEVFELRKDNMVRSGIDNYPAPMDQDLATLKSLIQTIVRDEIKRNQKD